MSENGIVDQANKLILYVSRTIPFRSGLDRHLVRAAMVFTFFVFSIQKWNQYTIEMLVPMISHSPSRLLAIAGLRCSGCGLLSGDDRNDLRHSHFPRLSEPEA